MKALIITTVWGRVGITEITYLGFDRIQRVLKEEGIDSEVLVISSEPIHTRIAKDRGYHVTEQPNDFLGMKYNNGVKYAVENLEWDYIFDMNSNNLVTDLYIRIWAAAAKSNVPLFGTGHFYALLPDRNRFTRFRVKNGGLSGVGRGISRKVIETCFSVSGHFCPPKITSAIDAHSRRNIESSNKIKRVSLCAGEYPTVLDIKTGEDMHHHGGHGKSKPRMQFFIDNWPELMALDDVKSLVI